MSKKEEEQIKEAGALAAARRRRGPAARRAYNDKVNDAGGGIDSMRTYTSEVLTEMALKIVYGAIPVAQRPTQAKRMGNAFDVLFKRLQEAHRSHDSKQRQTALFERKRLADLAVNIPTQDDPPLVRELWEKRLRELAGLPIEKDKK